MPMKIIGSILLIAACAGYGLSKGHEYKRHVEELDELIQIVHMFAIETSYSKFPIAELAERIAKKVEAPYKQWLIKLSISLRSASSKTLSDIWEHEAEELLKKLLLTTSEKEDFKKLGIQLANYNIEMQEQAFQWYARQLEERRRKLASEASEKQRLCNCLGILTGIFFVILLI